MGLKNFPTYERNPVDLKDIISVRKKQSDMGIALVKKDTGEILHDYDVEKRADGDYVHYDKAKFTKVYHDQMDAVKRFSTTGLKVLFYIFKVLPVNQDHFTIHVKECMDFCDFSTRTSVYKGLEELLKNNAINRKVGNLEFWINPNGFFNGSRVKYMEDKSKQQ